MSYDAETRDAVGELAGKIAEMSERITKLEENFEEESEIVSVH